MPIEMSIQLDKEKGRLGGHLIPLKTALETRARDILVDFYVSVVPVKHANTILKHVLPQSNIAYNLTLHSLVRQALPNDGGLDIQHLRRFAKFTDLPPEVRSSVAAARNKSTYSSGEDFSNERILLIGSLNAVTEETLIELLQPILQTVSLVVLPVPLLTPTSQEQAIRWSSKYWPTVYKKSNVFGPHPSLVSRAGENINHDIGKWIALATEVADKAYTEGAGERVGVVIVERRDGVGRPIAVASDARWLNWPRSSAGNVTAHAVMRAIAMVADGLKAKEQLEAGMPQKVMSERASIFRDQPHGTLEKENFLPSDQEGYLCHELEIYCTHEPCVMCSMAIVHSRFGKLVFQHRSPRTGGICADGELGHGLFWRKELNWTLLAWQWSPEQHVVEEQHNVNIALHV